MQALAEAEIYVLIDLPSKNIAIDRDNPSYTVDHAAYMKKKIDAFAKYRNTLGFFVGNEVVNSPGRTTRSAAYVKAQLRDAKVYMNRLERPIPIGYAAVDDDILRTMDASYFTCGNDQKAVVDFYAINVYSWCGADATLDSSGYRKRIEEFSQFGKPVFFSEYGCNLVRPRSFSEIQSLFNGPMIDVFSGGIMYEYSEEVNNYGIVQFDPSGGRLLTTEYTNFRRGMALIPRTYNKTTTSQVVRSFCPRTNEIWQSSEKIPAAPSDSFCKCISESLECDVTYQTGLVDSKDSNVIGHQFKDQIDIVCGLLQNVKITDSCSSISSGDPTLGTYPPLSYCSPITKLSYILNSYYLGTKRRKESCFVESRVLVARIHKTPAVIEEKCYSSGVLGKSRPIKQSFAFIAFIMLVIIIKN